MTDTSKTQSVLDAMTAGIMGKKDEKAAKLTPVGREEGGPLARAEAPFPFDAPGEQVAQAVRNIRREVDFILRACDAVDASLGPAEVVTEPIVSPQAEEFVEKFKAQSEKAKAAVFVAADEPVEAIVCGVAASQGWVCPQHGADTIVTLTSRKGRTYRSCTSCTEFEK